MKNILLELTDAEFNKLRKAKLKADILDNTNYSWRGFILRNCVNNRGYHKNGYKRGGK
jgi:hypothetical protein